MGVQSPLPYYAPRAPYEQAAFRESAPPGTAFRLPTWPDFALARPSPPKEPCRMTTLVSSTQETDASGRKSYARIPEVLEVPNLIQIQNNSFNWLLEEGIRELLDEITPSAAFGLFRAAPALPQHDAAGINDGGAIAYRPPPARPGSMAVWRGCGVGYVAWRERRAEQEAAIATTVNVVVLLPFLVQDQNSCRLTSSAFGSAQLSLILVCLSYTSTWCPQSADISGLAVRPTIERMFAKW